MLKASVFQKDTKKNDEVLQKTPSVFLLSIDEKK